MPTTQENKETFQMVSNHMRGSLKLETTSATPNVLAGKDFSIYVIIRNPFPVPVTIYGAETHIPIELTDETWRKSYIEQIKIERINKIENAKILNKFVLVFFLRLYYSILNYLSIFNTGSGPRIAISITANLKEALIEREKYSVQSSHITAARDVHIGDQLSYSFGDKTIEEIRQIIWEMNEHKQGRQPIVLNPGDSVVQHFILKTSKWILFAPIAHTFQIQVRYESDKLLHMDSVPFEVNIRAAIGSTLIGSIIGSILGTVVNKTNKYDSIYDVGQILLTSTIFAIIIVVAFARKNNVQQIISVEDFWGGLFLGFLVGYSGESFIDSVIATPKSN
jgi:hypothetical protein